VEIDISVLEDFDRSIYVSDVDLGPKVTILSSPDEMIARVNAPRVAVETEGEIADVAGEGAGADASPATDAPDPEE
jgi:hypothetical protein